MVPVAIVIFVGVFILGVVVLALGRSASLDYEAMRTRLHQPGAETLAYDVPEGQDAAALIVVLGRAGYTAVEDTGGGVHQVLVSCPSGHENARPEVRRILEDAGSSMRTIRFADER